MKPKSNHPPATVSLLALAETTAATLYALQEIFSAVGVAWGEITGEEVDTRRIDTRVVARDRRSIATGAGPSILPDTSLAEAGTTDVVIISDLALPPDYAPDGRWMEEAAWVRDRLDDGAIVCSVCTGSIFLAEAGILDGLEATSHWGATELFRRHYPNVRLRPERILCPAGPEHRIITSGGWSSFEELALHLIARFCGETEAIRIAKVFVLGDRSEGQLVFSAMGRPRNHNDAAIGDCQAWIADHYDRPNAVARMVARSGLAERTFKRRFKAATGYAPVDYVQALRIEEAKQILETTTELTDSVAHMVGYEDPAFFRRLFKRRTGVTPARYRQRFGVRRRT